MTRRRAWGLGVLAVVLAGGAGGVVWLLDRDVPVRDPAVLELDEEFRELQSKASRELERSGEWER